MADGFEPFHVPQQSRRDKLRVVVQNNPSCEESSTTLHGCAGLLPLYDPALISSNILTYSNAASHGFNQPCKPNPVCNVKEEGVNLMSCVGIGGFMNAPSSSSSQSHHDHPYLFPHSSLANPNSSIQDINNNPFLFTAQNLRNFDQSFNGAEMVNSTTPGQGLSLSLSSHHTHNQHHYYNQPSELNLQRYESAIFAEKGIGEYVGRSIIDVSGGSMLTDASRSSVPIGPFTGYASILKGSRFLKPAQQLLEELCDLGRGIYAERSCEDSYLMDPSTDSLSGTGIGTVDDPLTCGDGGKHRRKKMSLISMLDEVYRRYRQYYQQMQAVVASFESVAGLSNAAPYTSFALKAMSKHFRCLKNAITDQLRFTSKVFGEGSFRKDEIHSFGTTDRGLHSQTPVHSSSIIEQQHVWRPQRGLPERAVAVLRAWLFEHFLHPYPTDTDKQMLAKQTGLSRNQVSNWFINARVRLWKPMVEEIHTLETRQGQKASEPEDQSAKESSNHLPHNVPLSSNNPPQSTTTITTQTQDSLSKRCINEHLHISDRREPLTNFSCNNSSSHNHIGVGVNTTGGNNAVSLTLGLHHNNGIGLSAPIPMNIAQRFGLEVNSRGYAMDGYEAQNAHFGKDIGGQPVHDFVG